MIRKTFHISKSCVMFALHLMAAVFLLGLGLIGVALWQFSKGPIDMTFAADYIKDAFQTDASAFDVKFDKVIASWPDLKGSPDINLSNFSIVEGGEEKLHIGQVNLQLAILPLLIGQISPEVIILNEPVIRILRDQDGAYRLFLTDNPHRDDSTPKYSAQDIGESLFLGGNHIEGPLGIFSNLQAMNIRNAKLIAEDYMSGVSWVVPSISTYLTRTDDSFDLAVTYTAPGRKDVSALNARVMRKDEGEPMSYNADLRNVDLALFARNFAELEALKGQKLVMSGVVDGQLDKDWMLQSATATIRSDEGILSLSSEQEQPFSYKGLMLNLVYDRNTNRLEIDDSSMELNGTKVSISAERQKAADGKLVLPVTLKVPELTLEQVSTLWPDQYRGTNAGIWLTQNLSGATLRNINVGLVVPPEGFAAITGREILASFDFENLKADYRAPLIPATEAKGSATIKDDVLDIRVTSAKVGALNANSASIVITELASETPGEAIITVALSGPLSEAFEYISREPISLTEKIGIDPKKVGGSGDYTVKVTFPTSPDVAIDDVKVAVEATLNNTRLPGIVRGLDLTGGPLSLKTEGQSFTISGKGQLDGTPIELVYSEYIDPTNAPYASDIKAKLVTNEKMRHNFGFNIDRFVQGDMPIDIHYKEPKPGDVTIDVTADLTPSTVTFEQLRYTKQPGTAGSATCVAILKGGQIQQVRDLNVVVGKDKVSGGQLNFGTVGKDWDVKTGSFSSIALGADNQFSLKLSQPRANHLVIDAKGAKIDGRAFIKPDRTTAASQALYTTSADITADAKIMRTGDKPEQIVKDATLTANVTGSGDISGLDFKALVETSPFSLVMKPGADGAMVLRMTAADAGATLRTFDVYENMVGGQLLVEGKQIQGGKINDIRGTATVRDFRIFNAPVLARLMNTLSISGVGELLQGKGIAFSRLKAKYTWKETQEGRIISVADGRTSGASIGLSFGGTLNQTKGTLDISGTFVPMSEVNKIVSSIPLIGTLLTGGKDGGIIAATYAIKGKSEDPSVFVNPLSVLTPGFIRSILFEGGLDFDDEEEPEEKPVLQQGRSQYN